MLAFTSIRALSVSSISPNGELDPRYKKILDQLNKQQQQRAPA